MQGPSVPLNPPLSSADTQQIIRAADESVRLCVVNMCVYDEGLRFMITPKGSSEDGRERAAELLCTTQLEPSH